MEIKKLLRFYFYADDLESSLNNLISAIACRSCRAVAGCEAYANKIIDIIEDKGRLARLWAGLNGVMADMTRQDVDALKSYAALRVGIRTVDAPSAKEIHRASTKFSRRAQGRLKVDEEAYRALCNYYTLIVV